jgi:hypothetical protein
MDLEGLESEAGFLDKSINAAMTITGKKVIYVF